MSPRSAETSSARKIGATATALAVAATLALAGGAGAASASPPDAPARLTNLAHLTSLLDTVTPPATAGHTTYQLGTQPTLTVPWVYANALPSGGFQNTGGGAYDAATNSYGQGAFDTDDIARAAVVYLRDWKLTGSAAAKQQAYELLRSTAYFQTTTGPNAGNTVLWMQPDGTLNLTPTPPDTPNPSDSDASYWLARSLWAFGEGYAAFQTSDPAFAAFLQARIDLGVAALNRETLNAYGRYQVSDGRRVPAWLIGDGADPSGEALLGLAAYTAANPSDSAARTATRQLARGIAALGTGDTQTWPYGAILPTETGLSGYHSWSSQMPGALAAASIALHDPSLLTPAVADSAGFSTTQLATNGPDNGWYPTPVDQSQIAYGADSRFESLLAVADATSSTGFQQLAAMEAAWFFGANASGQPAYSPATGVTVDGIAPDGTPNRNGGAESTIHGLLAMIALDAHPAVAKLAMAASHVQLRTGLTVTEAETATPTTGTIVTPASAWTGESQFSGGSYLQLTQGQSATIALTTSGGIQSLAPVILEPENAKVVSTWSANGHKLGTITSGVGAQGISGAPGLLLPQTLGLTAATTVTVTATSGTLNLDAIITHPLVERETLTASATASATARSGSGSAATEMVHSASTTTQSATVGAAGATTRVSVYDAHGRQVSSSTLRGTSSIRIPAGGFAIGVR